ncbi:MAG: signal recognition particle-docking protein FtsY [Candidatus Marinimicrobia bacterium]|jgi:fused signal recognition particle receptor|nr:signal recognition particle-docking protein FtsY [Candidatus Neomarinimicrobiota bacterium]MBT3574781.1 signal recognition particle-docking protein FtsY [Candidatus Neomarinimicrobiota bacterium]MBT3681167.1 signal recognition particle-docking protein FtsY [Candidatus Neomarinimicrobiota bacterium]MBT3950160.1 signal recognition particle-docking protein FtsY [Candidatus Neomarinimicrobiota bacterium]MBT4254110.1 signal recognition particle-docking protein FtsY [Candidatus Neomarinimicrobiota
MIFSSAFNRLKQGLSRSRTQFNNRISKLFTGSVPLTDELLEEIEEILISADIGVELSIEIIEDLRMNFPLNQVVEMNSVVEFLKSDIMRRMEVKQIPTETTEKPHVILVVGVNGTGKTTSIGKLAYHYTSQGKSVLLVAGDTFRAAAIEQLEIWSERSGAELTKKDAADPSAVVYDALQSANQRGIDVVLIDTAGRLHTQKNLMIELDKIQRVVKKVIPSAPHETVLTIDATTGQNGLIQARQFSEVTPVDHLFLTKLDGTAKGGIAIAIHHNLDIPVKYIGIGEQKEDIQDFDAASYVQALFEVGS